MSAPNLVNHWTDMPEWNDGRRLWAVYLTFADQRAMHTMVARYQRALSDLPQFDRVHKRWLHLTLLGVAFTDEMDRMQAAELAEDCAEVAARHTLPTLVCERPELDRDSVVVPVTPKVELGELRTELSEESLRLLSGRDLYRLPEPINGFDPHITIAYCNAPVPRSAVQDRIGSVEYAPALMEMTHLSLIELTRGDRTWAWRQEQRLPLKSAVSAEKESVT